MSIFSKRNVWALKEELKGMSLQSIRQLAQENPIIPLTEGIEGLSDNVGGSAAVQNYCSLCLSQPDMSLEDVPSIIPSQALAREHAVYWMESLLPKSLAISTQVKQFCTTYGAMSDQDIHQLTSNLNDPSGKEEFKQVMHFFKNIAEGHSNEVIVFSGELELFTADLAADLTNFFVIYYQVYEKYVSTSGRIPQLKKEIEQLDKEIEVLKAKVAKYAVIAATGVVTTGASVAIEFTPLARVDALAYILLAATLITVLVGTGLLISAVVQLTNATKEYNTKVKELNEIQYRLMALQAIGDNFTSLINSNIAAGNAVLSMIDVWNTIEERFDRIVELTEGTVEAETQEYARTLLLEARDDTAELKKYAEECELNGVLPVKPSEEAVRILRLPSSWSKDAVVDSSIFIAFLSGRKQRNAYRTFGRLGRSLCYGSNVS